MAYSDPTNFVGGTNGVHTDTNVRYANLQHVIVTDDAGNVYDYVVVEGNRGDAELYTIASDGSLTLEQTISVGGDERPAVDPFTVINDNDSNATYLFDTDAVGSNVVEWDPATATWSANSQPTTDFFSNGQVKLDVFQADDGVIYGYAGGTSTSGTDQIDQYIFNESTQEFELDQSYTPSDALGKDFNATWEESLETGDMHVLMTNDGPKLMQWNVGASVDRVEGFTLYDIDPATGDLVDGSASSYNFGLATDEANFGTDAEIIVTNRNADEILISENTSEVTVDANGNIVILNGTWGTAESYSTGMIVIDPSLSVPDSEDVNQDGDGDVDNSASVVAVHYEVGTLSDNNGTVSGNAWGSNPEVTYSPDGAYMYITSANTTSSLDNIDTATIVVDMSDYSVVDWGYDTTSGLTSTDPSNSGTGGVSTHGPLSQIIITTSTGEQFYLEQYNDTANSTSGWLSVSEVDADIVTDPPSLLDHIVEGSSGDDLIDSSYTGDPEGDRIDNDDGNPITPDVGDNDSIVGYGGNDTIVSELGDDTILAGSGDDSVQAGDGDDLIYGDETESVDLEVGTAVAGSSNSGFSTTTIDVDGIPYVVTTRFATNGTTIISRVNPDGTLTETDRISYDNAAGTVTTTSDGDITSTLTAVGISANAVGRGLTQSNLSVVDGQPTLFLTSQNSGSITTWEVNSDGTFSFEGGNSEFGSSQPGTRDGIIRENVHYEGSDGTDYVYVARTQADRIDVLEYDHTTGALTETGTTFAAGDSVSSVDVISTGSGDYLAASSNVDLRLYSIDPATGDLTLLDTETPSGAGGNNSTEFYETSDGRVYAVYTTNSSDEAHIYEATASGLELTDSLSGTGGAYFSTAGYVDGEPVFVTANATDGVDVYTISDSGDFVFQTTATGIENDMTPPVIVQTSDGYYLVDADGNASTVPLNLAPDGDDTLAGGAGNDTIFGNGGNDSIDGGADNDSIDGGVGNDLITGGGGSDSILGGSGNDTIDESLGAFVGDGQVENGTFDGGDETGWTLTGDGVGGHANNGGALRFSQGTDPVGGEAETSVSVTAGQEYEFSFDYGVAGSGTVDDYALDYQIIDADGVTVLASGSFADLAVGDAFTETVTYTAVTSGDATIVISNPAGTPGAGHDLYVDNVTNGLADPDSADGDDTIDGGDGDDSINAFVGDDIILAGSGDDSVQGGDGDDLIYGDETGGLDLEAGTAVAGSSNSGFSTTTIDVDGIPHVVTTQFATNGTTIISRVNPDGTLTETDRISYDNAAGTVTTTSDGDITSTLTAAGISANAAGSGLTQSNLSVVDGQPTLFLTSQNSGSITTWEVNSDGTFSFEGGNSEFGSSQEGTRDGIIRENVHYEGPDGTDYVYVTRPQVDRIDVLEYDNTTGALTETGMTFAAGDGVSSVDVISTGSGDYLAASSNVDLRLYSIDPASGNLTLLDSETPTGAGEGDSTNFYETGDGRVYAIYSTSVGSAQAHVYEVTGSGLELTDSLSGTGGAFSTAGYVDGEPVFVTPNATDGVDVYTINDSGELVFQTTAIGIENDMTPPVIVQTSDGYYLVDADGNASTVPLNLAPDGDDTLAGGAGNDTIFGNGGNDSIDGGADDDSITGGAGSDSILGGSGNDTIDESLGAFVDDGQVENGTFDGGDETGWTLTGDGVGGHANNGGALRFSQGTDPVGGEAETSVSVTAGQEYEFSFDYGVAGSGTVDDYALDYQIIDADGVTVLASGSFADLAVGDASTETVTYTAVTSGDATIVISNPAGTPGAGHDLYVDNVTNTVQPFEYVDGNDTIDGGDGDDSINAYKDDDTIDGGAGNDSITGGAGSDSILGGSGNDTIDESLGAFVDDGQVENGTFDGGDETGWTLTGDGVGGHANNGGALRFSQGTDPVGGEAETSVSVTAGQEYEFSFDYGVAGSGTVDDYALDYQIIDADGVTVLASGSFADLAVGDAFTETVTYTAVTSGDATIVISNPAGTPGAGHDLYVDNVTNGLADPDSADGDDTIDGGDGDDSINAFVGDDIIDGGMGNDTIRAGEGDDSVLGGEGNDSIYGFEGSDTVDGGDGDDYINTRTSPGTGTPDQGLVHPDNPALSYPSDVDGASNGVGGVFGGPDDDRDSVLGGSGNDTILTGDDDDTIVAGIGNDVIDAGFDDDSVQAGDGADSVQGSEGRDTIDGGDGDDVIYGGVSPLDPNYTIAQNYNLDDDGVSTSADPLPDNNSDSLVGGAGNDRLYGQDDSDTLEGGTGNDTLDGGIDDDVLTGGADDDLFIYDTGDGSDTITDFGDGITGPIDDLDQTNNDFVDLSGFYNQVNYDAAVAAGDIDPSVIKNPLQWMRADHADDGILNDTAAGWTATDTLTIQNGGSAVAGSELTYDSTNVICFVRGTRIATTVGEKPVELLKVGDDVITRDSGICKIRWIGSTKREAIGLTAPILFRAKSIGNHSDLFVSPNHRMLINSKAAELWVEEHEVLIPAKFMVNDDTILKVEGGVVEYYHILFDNHEIVLAEGCWSESFHPGHIGLGSLSEETREEVLDLFPELEDLQNAIGWETARKVLNLKESVVVLAEL